MEIEHASVTITRLPKENIEASIYDQIYISLSHQSLYSRFVLTARQHAIHADRDTVIANPSVCLSVQRMGHASPFPQHP